MAQIRFAFVAVPDPDHAFEDATRSLVVLAQLLDEPAELVLTTRADNQAVLPMVLAAGLRGRIRMSGDRLTVRIPLAALQR